MNSGAFERIQMRKLVDMLDVNLAHNVFMTRLFLPRLIKRQRDSNRTKKCGFINVSSNTSYCPFPHNAVYTGTKHGLNALSEAVAYEIGYEIEFQNLCPSATGTNITQGKNMVIDKFCPASVLVHSSLSQLDPVLFSGRDVTHQGHWTHDIQFPLFHSFNIPLITWMNEIALNFVFNKFLA